jgi:hypothetical protein
MHHNQIINSSIIINIIINAKNESQEISDKTNEWPRFETTETSTEKPEIHHYQKPDFGLLKLNDRHERPIIAD